MTLEMAIVHREALTAAVAGSAHDPRMRWFHASYVDIVRKLADSTWGELEMVSLAPDGTVLGYLDASFQRASSTVNGLSFIRFAPAPSLEWTRDMARFLRLLYLQYGQHSVTWQVVVGSPHERSYDNLVRRLRGRIVGTFTGTAVLMNGERHDRKFYELTAAQLDRVALDRMAGIRRSTNGRSAGSNCEAQPRGGDARGGHQGAGAPSGEGAGLGGGDLRRRDRGADGAVAELGGADDAPVVPPASPLLSGSRTWPVVEGGVRVMTLGEYLSEIVDQQRRSGG